MAGRLPTTAILSACLFLVGISAAAVGPYRAIVAVDGLGMSNASYALIITVSSLASAAASPILGHVSDHIADRRWLVLACTALGALAYGLVYLWRSDLAYIVAFCVVLPFGGALFSQSFSYSRTYYNEHEPRRAEFMMSVLRSLFSLAWVVAPPIVGWIASTYTVLSVFAAAALAHIVFGLLFALLFLEPSSRIVRPKRTEGATPEGWTIPVYRLVGIGGVWLVRIALAVHVTTLPLVLIKDFGGTLAQVGINASVAALIEVPMMLLWGFAAAKVSKEIIIACNALLYGVYMIAVFFAHSVQEVLLLQVLNGVATAALLSITISYMQDAIRGRVGLSTSLMDVMTVGSNLAAAGLFALLATASSYVAVLAVAGVLSLVGAGVVGLSMVMRARAGEVAKA